MAKAWLRGLVPLLLLSCSEAPGGSANAAHVEAADPRPDRPYRPLAAPAEHRREAFAPVTPVPEEGSEEAGHQSARHCTADRIWCAQLERGTSRWSLLIVEHPPGDARPPTPLYFEPPGQGEGEPHFAIWPEIVREAGGAVLIGVLTTRTTSYAGGGARMTRLSLIRIEGGRPGMAEVLEVPVEAGATIRACFSEEGTGNRREACSDQYDFTAELTVIPPGTGRGTNRRRRLVEGPAPSRIRASDLSSTRPAPPPIPAAARAPRIRPRVRRSRRSDLVHWRDPECSYSRTFAYDAAARRYRPDSPLPACDDYLDFDWPGPAPPDSRSRQRARAAPPVRTITYGPHARNADNDRKIRGGSSCSFLVDRSLSRSSSWDCRRPRSPSPRRPSRTRRRRRRARRLRRTSTRRANRAGWRCTEIMGKTATAAAARR